jgi:hypothetical protein
MSPFRPQCQRGRPWRSGWAALCAAALLAGCGASKPLTHAELVAGVNSTCASGVRDAIEHGLLANSSDLAGLAKRAKSLLDDRASALAGLRPLPGDRLSYERFVADVRREARAIGVAAAAGKGSAVKLDLSGPVFRRAADDARALGFTQCVFPALPSAQQQNAPRSRPKKNPK